MTLSLLFALPGNSVKLELDYSNSRRTLRLDHLCFNVLHSPHPHHPNLISALIYVFSDLNIYSSHFNLILLYAYLLLCSFSSFVNVSGYK